MRWLILLLALTASVPAWAGISRTGSCAAASTSCTLSGVASGDLKLCFAYRSGSTSSPSVPSGWSLLNSGNSGTGGTTGAYIMGCSMASSNTDTSSGTWTGASAVSCLSYSGTGVTSAASCTTFSGSPQTTITKASTSLHYPNVSTFADGTSWVAAFAADSAALPPAPTTLTSVASAGTGPGIRASDTNGGVTSYAGEYDTVTSSTWATAVTEIHAPHVANVNILQSGGSATSPQTITFTDSTAGATFCYTTDSSLPTSTTPGTCSNGTLYSGGFQINPGANVTVIATASGMVNSSPANYTFGLSSSETTVAGPTTSVSTNLDSTGSVLFVAACYGTGSPGTVTISDDLSTWTQRPMITTSANQFAQVAYTLSPGQSIMSTENVYCNTTSSVSSLTLKFFYLQNSAFGSYTFDADCSNFNSASATSLASCASSFTPSVSSEFILSFLFGDSNLLNATIGSGFTRATSFSSTANTVVSSKGGYLISPGTAAVNPTWSWSASEAANTVQTYMIGFKPTSSGTSTSVRKQRVRVVQ